MEGNTTGHQGTYGAVELGHAQEENVSVFRREEPRRSGKLGVVIAALVAVLLTAAALSASSLTSSSSSSRDASRLMAPAPTTTTTPTPATSTGSDVAGPAPKPAPGWQDMVPKDVMNGTAPTITVNTSSHSAPAGVPAAPAAPAKPVPRKPGDPARNCTLDECKASGCDPATEPFVCVAGFAKGGCSKVQSAWEHPGCTDFCSLASCAAEAPTCGTCSKADCAKNQAVCGAKRPYTCVEGGTAGGCSPDADYWPQNILKGTCAKCCDLSTCEPVMTCEKCTPNECLQIHPCDPKKPYVCTSGAAMGGCGTMDVWANAGVAGTCTSCCDTAACSAGGGDDDDVDAPAN